MIKMLKVTLTKSKQNLRSTSIKGFTLIELLVVISIIGILASLIMANFIGVRERARDAQRKNDINQLQKALELYKQSQSLPQYPGALPTLIPNYMKAIPNDPTYDPACSLADCWPNYIYTPNADPLRYTLTACLENASDPNKDLSISASCGALPPASITRSEP